MLFLFCSLSRYFIQNGYKYENVAEMSKQQQQALSV